MVGGFGKVLIRCVCVCVCLCVCLHPSLFVGVRVSLGLPASACLWVVHDFGFVNGKINGGVTDKTTHQSRVTRGRQCKSLVMLPKTRLFPLHCAAILLYYAL